MRDSLIFYRSFMESFAELPDDERLQMYDAVIKYGLDGKEPKLSGLCAALFKLVKPQLDANERRYQNGLKGGRKPNGNQNVTKQEPNRNQSETKPKPNHNQTVTKTEPNVNVNDNVNANENKRACRFAPPTLDDVTAYCTERGNGIDPQRFMDYYQSNGWKVGKNPMKDWKAAVRTWEQRDAAPKKAEDDTEIRQYYQAARNTYPNNIKPEEGMELFRKLSKGNPGIARRLSGAFGELIDRYYSGEYGLKGFEKDLEVAYEYIRH